MGCLPSWRRQSSLVVRLFVAVKGQEFKAVDKDMVGIG